MLKIQEISPLKLFIFSSKCTEMRLVESPDPLGELTALPKPPSSVKGGGRVGRGKGEGRQGEGEERGREKETGGPPMFEVR